MLDTAGGFVSHFNGYFQGPEGLLRELCEVDVTGPFVRGLKTG